MELLKIFVSIKEKLESNESAEVAVGEIQQQEHTPKLEIHQTSKDLKQEELITLFTVVEEGYQHQFETKQTHHLFLETTPSNSNHLITRGLSIISGHARALKIPTEIKIDSSNNKSSNKKMIH